MPITPNPSPDTVVVHQFSSRAPISNFTLSAPPPARKRHIQRAPIPQGLVANQQPCKPTSPARSPRSTLNNRRRSSVTLRSPLPSFLSLVDSPENTIRKSSTPGIGLGVPGTRLSPSALNTIVAFASGKSHRRSVSGPLPGTAWSFETHFAPSPALVKASAFAALALTPSPTRTTPTPVRVLFERSRTLAALKANPQVTPSSQPNPTKTKTRPAPVMATKDGHVNVLLLPKRREKDLAPSIKSNASASTSASKPKSRKDAQSTQGSSASNKARLASNPALRAQRSLTPAREAFRPLPYATHAALDEFFGDPRKMNALHAHQSASNQLGARPDEVGYGNTIGHKGADGWIWFDALEEQEYAWLMSDFMLPYSPETPRAPQKEKKKPKRMFRSRKDSTSESEGERSDWESFDAQRRGSESGTSEGGIVDPVTYDLDPTQPPRYRAVADGFARYKVDVTAWDAAVHVRGLPRADGASTPRGKRGRSRRGSVDQGNAAERRRPPPLNLAAVSRTLAALGPSAAPPVPIARSPINLSARRGSLPILGSRLPPSLADAARADFVSSSFQPNPSKRDLNLDPETPWSANLPKDTIYRSIGSTIPQTPIALAPGSPLKSLFSRRASLTPLPLRHSPLPLPNSNSGFEFRGDGSLPKLPPMPMENGVPPPGIEVKRKASLADIFRRGFGRRK